MNSHGFGWSDVGTYGSFSKILGGNSLVNLKLAVINGLQSSGRVLDANTVNLASGPTVRPRDGFIQNETENKGTDGSKLTYKRIGSPLEVGFSYYGGQYNPVNDNKLTMQGLHFKYQPRNWGVKGEYVQANVEQTAGINPVGMPGALNSSTGNYTMTSYYLEGNYIPYRYGQGNKYVNLVARYDYLNPNDEHVKRDTAIAGGSGEAGFTPWYRSRWTVGTEWQFEPNARLRYEYQQTTIKNWSKAPDPYINSGGEENPTMHMASVIFWF
ncbi:MAG: hypothetical protein ABEK50_12750, partial [bacterium]